MVDVCTKSYFQKEEIIYNRHKNLEIIAGNLNDVKFEEKFDYVTLIGVCWEIYSFWKIIS